LAYQAASSHAAVAPVQATSLRDDLPVMIALVALLIPILLRGMVVSRWEGAFLLGGYEAFLNWQIYFAVPGQIAA